MNLLKEFSETQNKWFYSPKFNHAQKVNKGVYCYVSHMFYGYVTQLYLRRDTGFCLLEARSTDKSLLSLIKLFNLAEAWLEKYEDGNLEEISEDFYSISNGKGAWRVGSKDYWI